MRALIEKGFVAAVVMVFGCAGCRPAEQLAAGPPTRGEKGITSLATDGFFLFWTRDDGAVKKAGVDGSALTDLVQPSDPSRAADHVAVNGKNVFFTSDEAEGATLKRVPKDGGEPEVIVVEKAIVALVADEGHVCWMTGDAVPKCKEVEKSASLPPDVVSPAGPMVILSGTLFFVRQDGIRKAVFPVAEGPIDGEPVSLGSASGSVISLAATTTQLCWTGIDEHGDSSVQVGPLGGGSSRVVASGGSSLGNVACDAHDVFWVGGEKAVFQAPIDGGGSATPVVEGPSGKASFVMEADAIYVANSADGSVVVHIKNSSMPSGS
jgi:hypothetical protein